MLSPVFTWLSLLLLLISISGRLANVLQQRSLPNAQGSATNDAVGSGSNFCCFLFYFCYFDTPKTLNSKLQALNVNVTVPILKTFIY